jgi:hypothetical protein
VSSSKNSYPTDARREASDGRRSQRLLWLIATIGVGLFPIVVVAGAVVLAMGAAHTGFHLGIGTMLTTTGVFALQSIKTAVETDTRL